MSFYAISNKEGEKPRKNFEEYASPISNDIESSMDNYRFSIKTKDDINRFLKGIQQKKKNYGINFLNLGKNKNTIEFRLANGTIDLNTWIQNIVLFSGLVKTSEDLAKIQLKPEGERTKEEVEKLKSLAKIKNKSIPEEVRLESFLFIAIPEEKRDIYRNRYKVNMELIRQDKDLYRFLSNKTTNKPIDFIGKINHLNKEDDGQIVPGLF